MGATRVEMPNTKAVAIAALIANFMARRIMVSSSEKRPVSTDPGRTANSTRVTTVEGASDSMVQRGTRRVAIT
jgi:hypothetical protein